MAMLDIWRDIGGEACSADMAGVGGAVVSGEWKTTGGWSLIVRYNWRHGEVGGGSRSGKMEREDGAGRWRGKEEREDGSYWG